MGPNQVERFRVSWLCDGCKKGWDITTPRGYGCGVVALEAVKDAHNRNSPDCRRVDVAISRRSTAQHLEVEFLENSAA